MITPMDNDYTDQNYVKIDREDMTELCNLIIYGEVNEVIQVLYKDRNIFVGHCADVKNSDDVKKITMPAPAFISLEDKNPDVRRTAVVQVLAAVIWSLTNDK